ncbi:hypothetical protein SP39_20 [Salmonella phage 39]|nr:hypothetical protein SP39_20 [Salmonella phage 39]
MPQPKQQKQTDNTDGSNGNDLAGTSMKKAVDNWRLSDIQTC